MQYTVTGNTLSLLSDDNNDGNYTNDSPAEVYTKM